MNERAARKRANNAYPATSNFSNVSQFFVSGENFSLLCALTWRSRRSTIPFVQCSEGWAQRITIWTYEPKIFFDVISPVSIDMVSDERHYPCLYVYFSPATETTFVIIFSTQIGLYRTRDESYRIEPCGLSILPVLDVHSMLKFHLTCITTICIKRTGRLATAHRTLWPGLLRVSHCLIIIQLSTRYFIYVGRMLINPNLHLILEPRVGIEPTTPTFAYTSPLYIQEG